MDQHSYARPDLSAPRAAAVPGACDSLAITPDPDVATTIERFTVAAGQQDDAVAEAMAAVNGTWMADGDFLGAALLRGRPAGLAVYARWRSHPHAAPTGAPVARRSLAAALATYGLLSSATFHVAFSRTAPGVTAPAVLSVETAPLAHFGMFLVKAGDQDELLRRAADDAPRSLNTAGLRAINFHRGVDGLRVVNLGLWTGFEGFEALLKQPGFADRQEYFRDLATFEPAFFDVVAVKARPA